VHHHGDQIIDFVRKNNSFDIRIEFSDESAELLDTGGGLYKAAWFFDDRQPFVLTSSDVITDMDLKKMVAFHNEKKPLVTLAVKHRNSSRDFLFDPHYKLIGWHNNKTGETRMIKDTGTYTRAAFSTIHVVNPDIFGLIKERGKFSIIDVYLRLAVNSPVYGFLHDDSQWFECGRIENLETLNQSPGIKKIIGKYK
jgi:NDP-sugar pyrophosphorylase family protein